VGKKYFSSETAGKIVVLRKRTLLKGKEGIGFVKKKGRGLWEGGGTPRRTPIGKRKRKDKNCEGSFQTGEKESPEGSPKQIRRKGELAEVQRKNNRTLGDQMKEYWVHF